MAEVLADLDALLDGPLTMYASLRRCVAVAQLQARV
jgi:hypothetical protein